MGSLLLRMCTIPQLCLSSQEGASSSTKLLPIFTQESHQHRDSEVPWKEPVRKYQLWTSLNPTNEVRDNAWGCVHHQVIMDNAETRSRSADFGPFKSIYPLNVNSKTCHKCFHLTPEGVTADRSPSTKATVTNNRAFLLDRDCQRKIFSRAISS